MKSKDKYRALSLRDGIKKALIILKDTPESWLHFSAGQNTKSNLSRSPDPPRASGLFVRIGMYFHWLLMNSKLGRYRSKDIKTGGIYIFADSINQLTVLDPLVKELSSRGLAYHAVVNFESELACHISSNWLFSYFRAKVVFLSLLLFVIRFGTLYRSLKARDHRLISWRFNGFLKVYTWVVYFLDTIAQQRPDLVVVSNDHNPSTRSLIAVCRFLSIRTAYLQHASVSGRFHELQFTYSFLDGEMSYRSYLACEGRRSPSSTTPVNRSVFLTGIKRSLIVETSEKLCIGVAFKESDGYENLYPLVTELSNHCSNISIRCHPSTSKDVINKIKNNIITSSITLSDPQKQSVESYCKDLFLLICSNSSIHIEAAICNVPSIYYEMGVQHTSDYYSFVKNGLCHVANSKSQLLGLVKQAKNKNLIVNRDAVRLYSETFDTSWQGKESQLVADHIVALLNKASPEKLWGYRKIPI